MHDVGKTSSFYLSAVYPIDKHTRIQSKHNNVGFSDESLVYTRASLSDDPVLNILCSLVSISNGFIFN